MRRKDENWLPEHLTSPGRLINLRWTAIVVPPSLVLGIPGRTESISITCASRPSERDSTQKFPVHVVWAWELPIEFDVKRFKFIVDRHTGTAEKNVNSSFLEYFLHPRISINLSGASFVRYDMMKPLESIQLPNQKACICSNFCMATKIQFHEKRLNNYE